MKFTPVFVFLLTIFYAQLVIADNAKLTRGDYKNRADVEAFIDKMAAKNIYTQQQLIELFSNVKQQKRLFKKMNNAAERKLTWAKYRKIFITKKRINQGVKFYKENKALLDKVSAKYQVPAEIIVAIIGVETYYGRIKGKDPVFDTLVTFAFDFPKRAKFFTSELEHFISLSKEHNVDIVKATGSYAGAMGMPQFISSSYRSYAVDFDGDNKKDLWNSKADILASVANYFDMHGWHPNEGITYPLSVKKDAHKHFKAELKPKYKYKDFTSKGLIAKGASIKPDSKVSLIDLEQKNNKHDYWVGLHNFYVISRYNHSDLYSMAVFQLSQKIKAQMK
ncbi:MAG: lytic murein transglycosylase B [Gammaproteobacteria bacterium]|nr:lytic murein transglycosylase B [Gammaproteobacteria bacterium]